MQFYPPQFSVDETTGEVTLTAVAIPGDLMAPPTHYVKVVVPGTVTVTPIIPQEG